MTARDISEPHAVPLSRSGVMCLARPGPRHGGVSMRPFVGATSAPPIPIAAVRITQLSQTYFRADLAHRRVHLSRFFGVHPDWQRRESALGREQYCRQSATGSRERQLLGLPEHFLQRQHLGRNVRHPRALPIRAHQCEVLSCRTPSRPRFRRAYSGHDSRGGWARPESVSRMEHLLRRF